MLYAIYYDMGEERSNFSGLFFTFEFVLIVYDVFTHLTP